MPTLHQAKGESFVLARPGRYVLDGDRIGLSYADDSRRQTILLVTPLGDFAVSAVDDRAQVRIGSRYPLGAVELVEDGTILTFSRIERSNGVTRLEYTRQGPAIEFTLPSDTETSCAYSKKPLAGGAVRCGGCFKLYLPEEWQTELVETCPACGWTGSEAR